MTRDERQLQTLEKIFKIQGDCWLDLCTRYGKTRIAIGVFLRAKKKNPKITGRVIVPTTPLKKQWESVLKENGLEDIIVTVINGVIQKQLELTETILILDEAHLYFGEEFFKVYELSKKCRVRIPMSGTWSQKHKDIMNSMMPMADCVPLKLALREGWISDFLEVNLKVQLRQLNRLLYNDYHQIMDSCFNYFGGNWNTMRFCSSFKGASNYVKTNNIVLKKPDGSIYTHNEASKLLASRANIYMQTLRKRNNLLYNNDEKLEAVSKLIKRLKLKTITFGLTETACESLKKLVPDSETYHVNIKGRNIETEKLNLLNFPHKSKKPITKLSSKAYKEFIIKRFQHNEFKVLHSVKALDLGIDVQGIECAITYARYSNKEKQNQRSNRATTKEGTKFSLIVNVFMDNTKDADWLKACRYGTYETIQTFDNIEELANYYEEQKRIYHEKIVLYA